MKITRLLFLSVMLVTMTAHAQISVVKKNSKAVATIVVAGDSQDLEAANLLQRFVNEQTGVNLTIKVPSQLPYTPSRHDIVIGNQQVLPANISAKLKQTTEDGFLMATHDGALSICHGVGHGSIYGVVTLLEDYCGISYWSDHEYTVPHKDVLELPAINRLENPTFSYRQSQNYAMKNDPTYKLWYRLEEPKDVFAAGYFVHSFNKLLPAAVYGKDHPEYYAYYNGKRHPGAGVQWCLTNPEVFEIVANRVDSIFKANPGMTLISVSQNDGNNTNCRCPKCKAIDDYEGASSGSLIRFVNKLAKRFPDKQFSTLAYLYSMQPPKHVKPLPNVLVMLCDIDCDREVSLTENASGQEFMKALKGWAAITDNLYVWDYAINFDNYLSPFPNFHILQDNIKTFKKYHATMHFSQVAGWRGVNFTELRTYLVSKLMWNCDADVDGLIHHYLNGYYGAAGPYLYRYIRMMEGALLGSGDRLWIYDTPVSLKNSVFRPALLRRYNELFDEAEKAVADQPILLDRVRIQRLTLQYSTLELMRTREAKNIDEVKQLLALFEQRVKKYNVIRLNERSNSPIDYAKLYAKRYLPTKEVNLALHSNIVFDVEPTGVYAKKAEVLTDELFGGGSFVESWVGWEGDDASFVVDMKSVKEITSVSTDFLHQLGQWVFLPTTVSYSFSTDGEHYKSAYVVQVPENRNRQVEYRQVTYQLPQTEKVRYIRIDVEATKVCPLWHGGAGHPCWFFIDEVTVH